MCAPRECYCHYDGVFQVITFSRLKNRVGGYNRAAPAFGYVGRVYGVAGAPNHAKQQLAAGLSEATGLAKLLRIAGLYTVLDCLRHFAVP